MLINKKYIFQIVLLLIIAIFPYILISMDNNEFTNQTLNTILLRFNKKNETQNLINYFKTNHSFNVFNKEKLALNSLLKTTYQNTFTMTVKERPHILISIDNHGINLYRECINQTLNRILATFNKKNKTQNSINSFQPNPSFNFIDKNKLILDSLLHTTYENTLTMAVKESPQNKIAQIFSLLNENMSQWYLRFININNHRYTFFNIVHIPKNNNIIINQFVHDKKNIFIKNIHEKKKRHILFGISNTKIDKKLIELEASKKELKLKEIEIEDLKSQIEIAHELNNIQKKNLKESINKLSIVILKEKIEKIEKINKQISFQKLKDNNNELKEIDKIKINKEKLKLKEIEIEDLKSQLEKSINKLSIVIIKEKIEKIEKINKYISFQKLKNNTELPEINKKLFLNILNNIFKNKTKSIYNKAIDAIKMQALTNQNQIDKEELKLKETEIKNNANLLKELYEKEHNKPWYKKCLSYVPLTQAKKDRLERNEQIQQLENKKIENIENEVIGIKVIRKSDSLFTNIGKAWEQRSKIDKIGWAIFTVFSAGGIINMTFFSSGNLFSCQAIVQYFISHYEWIRTSISDIPYIGPAILAICGVSSTAVCYNITIPDNPCTFCKKKTNRNRQYCIDCSKEDGSDTLHLRFHKIL